MPDSLHIKTLQVPEPAADFETEAGEGTISQTGEQPLRVTAEQTVRPAAGRFAEQKQSSQQKELPSDSVVADTMKSSVRKGILIENPKSASSRVAAKPVASSDSDVSWVLLGMLLLFLPVAFRLRRNFRYLKGLLNETVSSRSRQNMFVDTMRETTFVIVLNILCVVSVAVFLAAGVAVSRGDAVLVSGELPPRLWECFCVTVVYYGFQWIAYLFIGNIFTTGSGTTLWLQGFRAGQGLLGLVLFPAALLSIFYPSMLPLLFSVALILYFGSRLLFILKGIRIFSSRPSYYIVFLYYLCGVEIVPVILVGNAVCLWG